MFRNWLIGLGVVILGVLLGWSFFAPMNFDSPAENGLETGIGGGPGEVLENSSPQPLPQTNLQILFTEHGMVVSHYLQALYDGKDTSETIGAVEVNNEKLANVIEQIGGDKQRFLDHWSGHVNGYENYTNALKNNDREGTDLARDALNHHAIALGEMINELIPAIPAERTADLMNEHIDLTLAVIEAHARGDIAQKAVQSSKANVQAIKFATILEDGLETSQTASPQGGTI